MSARLLPLEVFMVAGGEVEGAYPCRVCERPYKTPQGRGGHEWGVHGIPGDDPHSNNVKERRRAR